MNIQRIPVVEINPAPYNPRIDLKPQDKEYIQIKQSLDTFGCVQPLVWNVQTKNLVSGHQRLKVLVEQGITELEVSVVDLPIDKEKSLNIALNKVNGLWDESKLSSMLEELQEMPEFDISSVGFDQLEVTELFDKFSKEDREDDFDVEADVEKIEEPITKQGDIIELGNHRIVCGDCSQIETLTKLIGDKKVALIHTDPPYNVDYYGGNRPFADGKPKDCKHWNRIHADNMSQEGYEAWFNQIFTNVSSFLIKGAPIYIWNGHKQFAPMYRLLVNLGFHVSCVITWAKPNFAISFGDYNQQTEFCLYGWRENNGSHLWHGPNNESTLWEINRDLGKEYIHPTQKPIALAQRAMKNSSLRDQVVLDLFLGSGSTLIAAESLGRKCYGAEIEPRYCDAIVRRYIDYVGQEKVSDELKSKYLRR